MLFDLVMRMSPAARQWLIHFWYQLLSRIDTQGVMSCMNYGYADLVSPARPLNLGDDDQAHRYCIQLYEHVASAFELRGCDVLEVGCGRGGGASFVARVHQPRSLTGVDYSDRAIRFCVGQHAASGARFVPGDAEHLPFADASFDVAINVESSHCYPSLARFLAEVRRVLRPGGRLLYADFRERRQFQEWRELLVDAGFTIESQHDITANVVRALDLDHDRRRVLIERYAPRLISARLGRFAGLRGSPMYEGLQSRRLIYSSFVLLSRDVPAPL